MESIYAGLVLCSWPRILSIQSDSITCLLCLLDTIHLSYDCMMILFFFAGSWKVKREDIGKLRKNFLRRCFLNGLADFCNWNLPWRKHASVRVDICAMHEKAMNCKITLCVYVCMCVYVLYIIYFNRNVAIKLVDSKTNGFLFLR